MVDEFPSGGAGRAAPVPPTTFRLADVPAQPWKNGGGLTREIVCWPPGAGMDDFLWRVSVARIDAGGPFSRFAGVDRVITLLKGAGVVLRGGFAGGQHALTQPLAPFEFPGDVDVDCALQGGASEDFNVMSRRGRVRTRVSVIRGSCELPPATSGLLMAVLDGWQVEADDGVEYLLACSTGLWWAGMPQTWRVRAPDPANQPGDSALIHVAIEMQASGGDAPEQETT